VPDADVPSSRVADSNSSPESPSYGNVPRRVTEKPLDDLHGSLQFAANKQMPGSLVDLVDNTHAHAGYVSWRSVLGDGVETARGS
jgi:hypothetical protein